jgi:hypothetical protein
MEVFLRRQELQSSAAGGATGEVVSEEDEISRRHLLSMVEHEDVITSRFLKDIDMSIDEQLLESTTDSSQNRKLNTEPRYRSQAELTLLSQQQDRLATANTSRLYCDYDSSSSLSICSGPPSPRQPLQQQRILKTASQFESQPGEESVISETTTTTTTTTLFDGGPVVNEMATVSVDRSQKSSMEDQQGSVTSAEMTMISSATLQAIREQMAASLQRMKDLEEENKALKVLQVRVSVLKEEKKMLELQLKSRQTLTRTIGVGDCTVNEYDSSQAITRLPNGSEFSSDIHIVRKIHLGAMPSALSDGVHAKPTHADSCRPDELVQPTAAQPAGTKPLLPVQDGSQATPGTNDGTRVLPPPIARKPCRSIGVGDGNVFLTEVAMATQNSTVPIRIHEHEVNTEVHEKEVKTVFLSGPGVTEPCIAAPVKPQLAPKPKPTRSIGVGDANVFDVGMVQDSTSLQVHEKELRTVYIDGGTSSTMQPRKSTRNVGILCRAAMRDVGVMYHYEDDTPMTRNVAVGVGEIGVNELGYFSEEAGGGRSDSSVHITNMALQQLNMAAFQSRHLRFSNEQLRDVLDAMLKKNLRSVAVQCRFATIDRSVSTVGGATGTDGDAMKSVGVSDDTIDVDVMPVRQFRSVAIDNRPSVFHRASGADVVYRIDSSTNTHSQLIKVDRSSNTDKVTQYPAATNTEPRPQGITVCTETDASLLVGMTMLSPDDSGAVALSSVTAAMKSSSPAFVGSTEDKFTRDLARQKKRDSMSFGISSEPSVAIVTDPVVHTTVPQQLLTSSVGSLTHSGNASNVSSTNNTHPIGSAELRLLSSRAVSEPTVPVSSSPAAELMYTSCSDDQIASTYVPSTYAPSAGGDLSDDSVDTQCSVVWKGNEQAALATSGGTSGSQESSVVTRTTRTIYRQDNDGSSRDSVPAGQIVDTYISDTGRLKIGFDDQSSERLRSLVGGLEGSGEGQEVIITETTDVGGQKVVTKETRDSDGQKVIVTETRSSRLGHPTQGSGGQRVIVTETVVERRSGGGGPAVGGSMSDSSLRSIMKSATAAFDKDQSPVLRRKISFLDDAVTTESESPVADPVSGSDDSQRSSASFEEGTYDGRHGYVTYTCKDDAADSGAEMFEQHLQETYDVSAEMSSASATYAQWLEDSTHVSAKELNAAMTVIQQEWFTVSSHKLANASQVTQCLQYIDSVSHNLLVHVVNMADANGNTALHYAVSHGNFDVVNVILDSGEIDVNRPNRAGYTAIMLASLADIQTDEHRGVVEKLFHTGNVNLRATQAGQTALMLAVSHGKLELVRMLIEAGADINVQDDDGSTALMCASEHGHVDLVKLLLSQPTCDANITDNDGSTAMSIAMEAGHRDVGVLLYAHVNFRPTSPKLKKKTVSRSSVSPAKK